MTEYIEFYSIGIRIRYYLVLLLAAVIEPFEGNKAGSNSVRIVNKDAGKILDIYGNSILRLAFSYLHNIHDAEDIVQDTLIKYINEAPVFSSETHEKAWLLRVSSNLSKNRIKYNKIRCYDELNEMLVDEGREDLSFVWDAVKQLKPKQSEIIHLFYEEGYQTAEIADLLGEKEATVRSHLKRAREKLKSILEEGYDFE